MTDLSIYLNEEQLSAATAPDGYLLVLAAAGTGKTRTLVYRVAHLIERGVDPRNILLLTFTNRAAREMLERAREVVRDRVHGIWGGTFHHIANRILRRYAPRIGYPNDFTIMDADEQRTLIGNMMKQRKLTVKEFMRREVLLSLISGARNRQMSIEEYAEPALYDLDVNPEIVYSMAEEYAKRKSELKAMDFDDLLINALDLLKEHEEVRINYQNLFHHVLVDEYQDTNILQAEFVETLAAKHGNLTVVGDDFQCIYSWRGADFRNIMDFPTRHPETRIVKLEQNYRSVPGVLEVANACIAGNPEQFQKTLRPTRKAASQRPHRYDVFDGNDQAKTLIRLVQDYHDRGYDYSDIAVLYRAHFHSIELQIELARTRIPHRITSGVGVFEQAHVKDVLSFFRLLENPHDRLAFDRLLGMLKGVGPSALEKLWTRIGGSFDASDAESRDDLRRAMTPKVLEQWQCIAKLFDDYGEPMFRPKAGQIVAEFLEVFYRGYLHRNYDNPDDRGDDLTELANQMERSESVRAFLSEVALLTNVDHAYEQDETAGANRNNRVSLGTVHQAKGLEWPIVIIPWVVEGMFPSSRSLAEETGSGEAEERRLFYVAVTRAKDDLAVLVPQSRFMRDGGYYSCTPSRFVTEIPEHLMPVKAASYHQRYQYY